MLGHDQGQPCHIAFQKIKMFQPLRPDIYRLKVKKRRGHVCYKSLEVRMNSKLAKIVRQGGKEKRHYALNIFFRNNDGK